MGDGQWQSINRGKNKIRNEGGRTGNPKPIDISKIKDQSLQGIENRIRNLSHEEMYIFDKDDNLIAGYKGGPTSVSFPIGELWVEGATVTHGHPKGEAEFGGTFSFADVYNMLNSDWAEHRATASGQGEMNYILRKGKNANPSGFASDLSKNEDSLMQQFGDAYRNVYKDEIAKGTSDKQATHIARQEAVGLINAYYKETAPKYGYEYITRKKNYTYNR